MELKEALERTPKPQIRHFKTWTGTKWRTVAEPQEPLKTALRELNQDLGDLYEQLLEDRGLSNIPQAYRRGRSVRDNAAMHAKNQVWYRYDFSGFYDTVRFENFAEYLTDVIPDIQAHDRLYRNCFIDPKTNGLTQGSPTSGVLAGIACMNFWAELMLKMPEATITQYSDDLCVSGTARPQWEVTAIVMEAIHTSGLDVKLNQKKTRMDAEQHRRLTGVSCNARNELTPRRTDYRNMRALLHNLRARGPQAMPEGTSACRVLGQLAFMSHIDESGKIEKLQDGYTDVIEMLKQMRTKELGGNEYANDTADD